MPEPRGRVLVAAWGAGLAGAAAWVPFDLQVRAQLAEFAAPPMGATLWGALAVTFAAAVGAGWWAGWRDRRGVLAGVVAGSLAAGLAWALGAFPGLAIEGQWAVWMAVPERQYGQTVLATAMADTVPRSALNIIGASWVALAAGAVAGGTGALLRPPIEAREPAPPFFAAQVVAVLAIGAAFLMFTLSAQLLPGLEKSTNEPLFEVDRFALLVQAVLAAFSGLLIGASTLWIWRRAAPRWKFGAGAVGTFGALLCAAPWLTTWIAQDYAWLRQFYVYAAAAPVGLVLGAIVGKKGGSRRPPTGRDLLYETALLGTLLPWLLLGPCGLGAGLALSRGVTPLIAFLMDAHGDPDPVGFASTLMYTGAAMVPWSAAFAVVSALAIGGPMLLWLREPAPRQDKLAP